MARDQSIMLRRVLSLAIIIIAVVATIATSYVYLGPLFQANSSVKPSANPSVTVLNIPRGSSAVPNGFNVSYFQEFFLTGMYPFPVNIVVTIGVNNTIEWVNQDTVGHTVTALVAPSEGLKFNSGLILAGKTFSVTLTVPGVYRYTCAWHNWLAGQITVKLA
jgi:ABC-type antimicrobial peptide transport system permease subunit